uniref:CX domain-containing protein n=2 Tax=Strongyloides papillosus TaxID=174720 RepID=A0A0N5CAC0_STREA
MNSIAVSSENQNWCSQHCRCPEASKIDLGTILIILALVGYIMKILICLGLTYYGRHFRPRIIKEEEEDLITAEENVPATTTTTPAPLVPVAAPNVPMYLDQPYYMVHAPSTVSSIYPPTMDSSRPPPYKEYCQS